jgi:formylglycine-generating enzyme required for sulfatase activity
VVLVAVVLAAPWLATSAGLLRADVGGGEVAVRDVVRLRPELVLLPRGRFMMGSPKSEVNRDSDEVQHEVEVLSFLLCRTEVTNEQWKAVMGSSPSLCAYGCGDNHPVQNVTWEQATEYLNKLTDRENALFAGEAPRTRCYTGEGNAVWVEGCTGYRLPTEAEWEYAARAGTTTAYSFGDDPAELCKHGNGADQAAKRGHPEWTVNEGCDDGATNLAEVGKYAQNPWGLFDMHGNVWEWVWDWYDDNANSNGNVTGDPIGPQTGEFRVLRGGSFGYEPWWLRSALRIRYWPTNTGVDWGFRCARGSPPSL